MWRGEGGGGTKKHGSYKFLAIFSIYIVLQLYRKVENVSFSKTEKKFYDISKACSQIKNEYQICEISTPCLSINCAAIFFGDFSKGNRVNTSVLKSSHRKIINVVELMNDTWHMTVAFQSMSQTLYTIFIYLHHLRQENQSLFDHEKNYFTPPVVNLAHFCSYGLR